MVFSRVRVELKDLLEQARKNTSMDVALSNQVQRLELPLIFVIDNLICTNRRLRFAEQWAGNRLAKERNELAGDESFFEFLDKDLRDTSEEAAERLAVYYCCLGLGFTGMWQGQPEKIRTYMEQIFPRIRQWIDSDPRSKISEEAYQSTDTRVLTEPPNRKLVLVALGFLFVCLSLMIFYCVLYKVGVKELESSIELIQDKSTRR